MEYIYECCPLCGCTELVPVRAERAGDDVFFEYDCPACDNRFHSKEKKDRELAKRKREVRADGKAEGAREIFARAVKSTISIECRFDGFGTFGTGIVLSDRYMLTNAHILTLSGTDSLTEIANEILAKTEDGGVTELEFVTADFASDIAILRAASPFGTRITLATARAQTGDKIYTIGNSKGEGLCLLEGLVGDEKRILDGRERILFTATVTHGNSGGPLLDARGCLVGMVTNGRKDAVGMNYAIPTERLLAFVRFAEDREEIRIL